MTCVIETIWLKEVEGIITIKGRNYDYMMKTELSGNYSEKKHIFKTLKYLIFK